MSATVLELPQESRSAISEAAPRAEWWPSTCEWGPLLPAWRASHRRWSPQDLESDPDWCRGVEEVYPGTVRLVVFRHEGAVWAVVPTLLRRKELDCHLGEWRLARFRPRILELAGTEPGLPPDGSAYPALLEALLAMYRRSDALSFTLPAESSFSRYLAERSWARLGLHRYHPAPPLPHHLLRLPETFAAYVAKFTPKTRKNRFRELKHLEAKGAVELICYRRPEQVEEFLAEADALSQRSYQHKMLKAGLRAPQQLRRRLEIAAERGWLRGYVLRCGGAACSYMLGYQYQGRYLYTKVGYDPEWKHLSVGTVLQLLVLQHLYESDTPEVFDFGVHAPQKQYFGNEEFEEVSFYLFQRRPYAWLARSVHRGSRRVTARGAAWLDRHKLKPQVQRLLRRVRGC